MNDSFGGIDPPDNLVRRFEAIKIPPPAICKKCGEMHGIGVLNTETGIYTPMDLCNDCFWKFCTYYFEPKEVIDDASTTE